MSGQDRHSQPYGHAARLLGAEAVVQRGGESDRRVEDSRIVSVWGSGRPAQTREQAHHWILEAVAGLVGAGGVGIFELTPDCLHVRLTAGRGLDRRNFPVGQLLLLGKGRIAATAQYAIADFDGAVEAPDDLRSERGLEACIPLWASSRLIGTVAVYRGSEGRADSLNRTKPSSWRSGATAARCYRREMRERWREAGLRFRKGHIVGEGRTREVRGGHCEVHIPLGLHLPRVP